MSFENFLGISKLIIADKSAVFWAWNKKDGLNLMGIYYCDLESKQIRPIHIGFGVNLFNVYINMVFICTENGIFSYNLNTGEEIVLCDIEMCIRDSLVIECTVYANLSENESRDAYVVTRAGGRDGAVQRGREHGDDAGGDVHVRCVG